MTPYGVVALNEVSEGSGAEMSHYPAKDSWRVDARAVGGVTGSAGFDSAIGLAVTLDAHKREDIING